MQYVEKGRVIRQYSVVVAVRRFGRRENKERAALPLNLRYTSICF